MTEVQGEGGVIQFGGMGRYQRTSHWAEIENEERFHICVLQKCVLCKTLIFSKLKRENEDIFP